MSREPLHELEFEDTFDGSVLDERRWMPCYLPQWSSRERAAARYVDYVRGYRPRPPTP